MSETTLDQIEAQIKDLFNNQAYGEALALASQAHASGNFPEAAPFFYYYQICAATRLQDTASAFQLMDQMLNEGLWLGTNLLRESPSLKQLQDDPAFERLVNQNYERQHAIPATTVILEPRERPAQSPSESFPLLLVLHKNGGSAKKAMTFWRHAAQLGWLVALPQSTQFIWADAGVWDDLETTCQDVLRSLENLRQRYPIDSRRVIFAGHSLGGQMAIRFLLDGPFEGQGFIAIGPYLPEIEPFVPLVEACEGRSLRGYIIAGEQDQVISHEMIRSFQRLLNERNFPCEVELAPETGHEYPLGFGQYLDRALRFIMG